MDDAQELGGTLLSFTLDSRLSMERTIRSIGRGESTSSMSSADGG